MTIKGEQIKVLGFMPLHFGSEMLKESILKVLPYVDEFLILYSPLPSFGNALEPLPESESMQNLYNICDSLGSKKIVWTRINACRKETHINYAHQYATKDKVGFVPFDVSLQVHSNELWSCDVEEVISKAYNGNFRQFSLNRKMFFKTETVPTNDSSSRVYSYNNYLDFPPGEIDEEITDYSYACSAELMKYKLSINCPLGYFDRWNNYKKKDWYATHKKDTPGLHPNNPNIWHYPE